MSKVFPVRQPISLADNCGLFASMMQAFFNRRGSNRLGLPSAVGLWLGILAVIVCGVTLKAESVQVPQPEMSPRDLHVWGRFDPGTWKRVRIVTETLNERGRVV